MVHIGELSRETRRALENYSELWGYDEWLGDRTWIEPERFAWLIELLKAETDTPELFPKGKWATIQRMQIILGDSALCEIEERKRPDVSHGETCKKKPHDGTGYLHDLGFDGPYDVDGVRYCGRCHEAI